MDILPRCVGVLAESRIESGEGNQLIYTDKPGRLTCPGDFSAQS